MLRLADRGQPTDPVTVLGELDDSGELADVGGGPFLHTLVQAVPTVANAGHYARLVAEAARRRRVIDLGIRLAHSDADPAVLAHLAGELADTTTAAERGARLGAARPVRGCRRGARLPGRGPARLAGRVRGRGRHRHPDPTGSGRHARPGRARHRRRRRRRGRAPARLARAAVPVRRGGHGRRDPQEQRVHRHDPAGRRLRTRAGGRRPARRSPRRPPCAASPTRPPPPPRPPPARPRPSQQEERRAEAIARAAEAASLVVPPVPRWLVDDATPEALAGLLATYGRIALLSPEGDVFDQMAGRYNQSRRPQPGRLPQGPRRRPAQGRPPRPTPRVRRAALSDHRPDRPARGPARAGRPARVRRPRAAGPVPVQPPREPGRPPPARRPTRPAGGGRPLHPGAPSPGRQPDHPGRRRRPGRADPRPGGGRAAARLRARPGAAAGRRQRRPGPSGRLGGQARRRHLPPRRPAAPGQPPPRRLGPTDQRRHLRRRRPAGRLPRSSTPERCST